MHDDRKDPREIFSNSAGRYLISSDHQSGPDLEIIKKVASNRFPGVTVDVATGAGHALRAASPYSGFCVALDLTMEMLQVTREHLHRVGLDNIEFIQSTADHLPLSDKTVALLTCRIAPHHFPSVAGFLEEVSRVLESDGRCIIIDSIAPDQADSDGFINEIERLRDPSHVRSQTLKQWLDLCKQAGLETISVELFERTHPFREWAARTGLNENEIIALEERFKAVSPIIRARFKVQVDENGRVESYTDEKGIFVLKKVNSES